MDFILRPSRLPFKHDPAAHNMHHRDRLYATMSAQLCTNGRSLLAGFLVGLHMSRRWGVPLKAGRPRICQST
jgi:hypothetical protein